MSGLCNANTLTAGVELMTQVRAHPKLKDCEKTVFIGHSLGGTIAAILATVQSTPTSAIIFNAPGWYLSSDWLCGQMRSIKGGDAYLEAALKRMKTRICGMDPAMSYKDLLNTNTNPESTGVASYTERLTS